MNTSDTEVSEVHEVHEVHVVANTSELSLNFSFVCRTFMFILQCAIAIFISFYVHYCYTRNIVEHKVYLHKYCT